MTVTTWSVHEPPEQQQTRRERREQSHLALSGAVVRHTNDNNVWSYKHIFCAKTDRPTFLELFQLQLKIEVVTYSVTGKVKWELPKEEKKFRDVGKLKMPQMKVAEHESQQQDVGKLKWGGVSFMNKIKSTVLLSVQVSHPRLLIRRLMTTQWLIPSNAFQFQFDQEENKEEVKEKPKVGKLKFGGFGGGPAEDAPKPPPKRSWKKKVASPKL